MGGKVIRVTGIEKLTEQLNTVSPPSLVDASKPFSPPITPSVSDGCSQKCAFLVPVTASSRDVTESCSAPLHRCSKREVKHPTGPETQDCQGVLSCCFIYPRSMSMCSVNVMVVYLLLNEMICAQT